jgi:hypothetical protein
MEIVSREYVIEHLVKHNDVMSYKDLLEIEACLGFELTPSQIVYIITGQMRYTGLTTAQAIRDYLICRDGDMPLLYSPHTNREFNEARHKMHTIEKLERNGMQEIKIILR